MSKMLETHAFKVAMTCEGCSGAVERVLGKLRVDGIENVQISLPEQKVTVTGTIPHEELLKIIKKTGKETSYIGKVFE